MGVKKLWSAGGYGVNAARTPPICYEYNNKVMSVKKNSMSVSLKVKRPLLGVGLALTGALMIMCGGIGLMIADGNDGRESASSACVPSSSGADRDCDGVANAEDNCPTIPNPDQQATGAVDPNGAGDACDNVVDDDGDGLIEIWHLEALSNIRYDLDGSHYDDEEADSGDGDAGSDAGCPASGCNGYELMRDLDFATISGYMAGAINPEWRSPGSGWPPIAPDIVPGIDRDSSRNGHQGDGFAAILDGNGNAITNLYIDRRTENYVGFIGATAAGSQLRNLTLSAVSVTGGHYVGGLVGQSESAIVAASVGGDVTGYGNAIGGLVGLNEGVIVGSYASGSVTGSGVFDNSCRRTGGMEQR